MNVEAKVGLFVFIGLLFLFFLSTQVNNFVSFGKDTYKIYAYIDNASGLEKSAKVTMNGVNIGKLSNILLEGVKVKLELLIQKDVKIPKDSKVILIQESFLGGKMINIIPSKVQINLDENESLVKYKNLASFEQTSDSINKAAIEFKELMKDLRKVLDEKSIKNLKQSFKNINEASYTINKILEENRKNLYLTIKNLNFLTSNLTKKIPPAIDKFTKIEDKINEILVENKKPLNNTLKSANKFFASGEETFLKVDELLSSITKSTLEFSMSSMYHLKDEYMKIYLDISYLPNPHTYYLFNVALAPDYTKLDKNKNIIKQKKHDKSKLYISAQYAKRYSNLILRAGLIENTGGLGIDYLLINDNLKLFLEIYDFNAQNDLRGDKAHLKTGLRYKIFKHINLYAGVDNILNKESFNAFLGIGFSFIENDIKSIIGSASSIPIK